MEIVRLLLPYSDYIMALENPGLVSARGHDLLLSCLPAPFAKQFMAKNPDFYLPRARDACSARLEQSKRAKQNSKAQAPTILISLAILPKRHKR